MKSKKTETLEFSSLYTIKGLYADEKGNEFNIYVSGEKKEVDRFIRYQKRQLTKGIIGIYATVTRDPDPSFQESVQPLALPRRRRRDGVELKAGKVKIGISRHRIVTKRPYQITYHIDPKIKTPLEGVGLNENMTPAPDFEFEFDGPMADVLCRVQTGKVEFSLIEVGKTGFADGPKVVEDIPNSNADKLVAHATGAIQKWRVEATGKRPGKESMFDLEYTKKFS
jgi:hypothetical protein